MAKITSAEYEKSALDKKRDKMNAKKHGMSVADWEGSPGDEADDTKQKAKLAKHEKREPKSEERGESARKETAELGRTHGGTSGKISGEKHSSVKNFEHEGYEHTSEHR